MDSSTVRICRAGLHLSGLNEERKTITHRKQLFFVVVQGTFQNIEANPAQLVNVGVVNFCDEADFRGRHGVVLRQEQL